MSDSLSASNIFLRSLLTVFTRTSKLALRKSDCASCALLSFPKVLVRRSQSQSGKENFSAGVSSVGFAAALVSSVLISRLVATLLSAECENPMILFNASRQIRRTSIWPREHSKNLLCRMTEYTISAICWRSRGPKLRFSLKKSESVWSAGFLKVSARPADLTAASNIVLFTR